MSAIKHNYYLVNLLLIFFSISILQAAPSRIMPLGDSITYGTPTNSGYRNYLWYQLKNNQLDVDFVGSLSNGTTVTPSFDTHHEGHPGWTSHDISEKTYQFMQNANPDTVLLHIGTNDHSSSTSGVESILNEIDHYERNTGKPIRVFVALIIDRQAHDPIINAFNNNLRTLVTKRWENGDILSIVNMYGEVGFSKEDFTENTHPNNSGYQKMANVWFKAITTPFTVFTSAPTAVDDEISIETGSVVTLNITSNDSDRQNDMNISSVNLIGGLDTDKDGDNDKLTVPDQGIWVVDEEGIVTFTPYSGFTADPTTIYYTIKDTEKKVSSSAKIKIDYTNHTLEAFPQTIVHDTYIESTTIFEETNTIEFITRIPNNGITF